MAHKFRGRWLGVYVLLIVTLSSIGCMPAVETQDAAMQATVSTNQEAEWDEKRLTILIPEDPIAFNGVVADTGYGQMVMELVMLGVADADPYGNVFPELANELPTIENGGVQVNEEDGTMDVTWKLRQDIRWADGEPVTAEDVIFTWNALTDPEKGIWVEGVDYTDSVEKIDAYTFVVHYNSVYPAYLLHFGGENLAIYPAHYCDATQGFTAWECGTKPLSNGPYILKEWQVGDHLTFVRNPYYYKSGQPYIEQIEVKIVPDKEVEETLIRQGKADVIVWATESMVGHLLTSPNVKVSLSATSRWVMRLIPNLAARGTTDAQATPHPILSDVRVRHAIQKAIDVDRIIKEAWQGYPTPVWSEFFRSPYICSIPRPQFDPQAAATLLEEAGWKDTDWDGVRECQGCSTAEPGYPMSIELATYSEYGPELEHTQELIAEMLRKIGIGINLKLLESGIMWADVANGGSEQTGDFDLDLWDDGYSGLDPTDFLRELYYSESAQPDNGWNVGRWINSDFDALIDQVYSLDQAQRKLLFCEMAQILDEELPIILLFSTINADALSTRVQGAQSSNYDMVTWNIDEWKLLPSP